MKTKLVTFQVDVTAQLPYDTDPDNVFFAIPHGHFTVLENQPGSAMPRKVQGAIVVSHTTSHVVDSFTEEDVETVLAEAPVSPEELSGEES